MSGRTLTGMVAQYVHALTYDAIPAHVVEPICDSLLDAVGCGVVGSTSRDVRVLTNYFAEMKSAPQAVIWGTPIRACAPLAAAANAAAVHGWDFDDTVMPGIVHPAGVVLSTALAMSEKGNQPVSGKALLTAAVAGYEVGNLMSAALGGREWRVHGFYNTVPMIFGATATAGKLLGLTEAQLVGAIGIAATQASGLYSATMTKRLNSPKAVEGGIYAAELALGGYEAPLDGLGGDQGFLKTFSRDPKLDVIPRDIGKYAFEVYHKAYPCIRSNQPAIYAARLLQDEHPSEIVADKIRRITVHADRLTRFYTTETAGGGTAVETIGNALVSLPYGLASMLVNREFTLEQITPEAIREPAVQLLMGKVEILVDPEIDKLPPTQRYRATVEIELTDGRRYKKFCPAPKGDPTNRLTADELRLKFMRNTTRVFESTKMEALYELLRGLANVPDVRAIPRMLLKS
jgi:aconitate decarboxylase